MSELGTLGNLLPRSDLLGVARHRGRAFDEVGIDLRDVDDRIADGWTVVRSGKKTARIRRPKRHDIALEDRVWTLFWRMGFSHMSGPGGAILTVNPDAEHKVTSQIDVVGVDEEIALAVECKSALRRGKRPDLQQEMAKHALIREAFGRAMPGLPGTTRQAPVLILWAQNATVSRNDLERARESQIVLLGDDDLEYFEALVRHLGPAARFQFLAEVTPGKRIPGLARRVPALKEKLGGFTCYTFSVAPDYLLKISYVAHRTRGKQSSIKTYQRMVSRTRLKKIASYIQSGPGAIFPTNIVINFDTEGSGKKGTSVQFERSRQEEGSEGATFGWLRLRPTYKSAWIIDGQHRLYAYSLVPPVLAEKSRLSVLAFDGLPGSIQQKLFIDINAQQKSVKPSLYQELYADIHRGSDDPRQRTQALISEAVQELDTDSESPFLDRILLADRPRTETRCISLTSMFSALDRPGLYFRAVKGGAVYDPGPLWSSDDAAFVARTTSILNAWFGRLRDAVPDWWDAGAAPGGGLAMNDGVAIGISLLRSVAEHLDRGRVKLADQSIREVAERITPYAHVLGANFASFSPDERIAFRALRGNQGLAAGTRHGQQAIQLQFPDFQPEGLAEYLEREKAHTNDQAASLINEVERILARVVISALKDRYGVEADAWWYEGVPKTVRAPAMKRQDDNKNARGARERYLDFIDYRDIARDNWVLLGPLIGYGKRNLSKDVRTEWIVRINEIRQIAVHGSAAVWVSFEQLSELQNYLAWLKEQVTGTAEAGPDSDEHLGNGVPDDAPGDVESSD